MGRGYNLALDFARGLERELNQANGTIAELRAKIAESESLKEQAMRLLVEQSEQNVKLKKEIEVLQIALMQEKVSKPINFIFPEEKREVVLN